MAAQPRRSPAVAERRPPRTAPTPIPPGCHPLRPVRPLCLSAACLYASAGSHPPGRAALGASWRLLSLLSLDPMPKPFIYLFFPPAWFPGREKQMGFSRKATTCLLHLPFPPPCPREPQPCSCHGNCSGKTCCFLQAKDSPVGRCRFAWVPGAQRPEGAIGACFTGVDIPQLLREANEGTHILSAPASTPGSLLLP